MSLFEFLKKHNGRLDYNKHSDCICLFAPNPKGGAPFYVAFHVPDDTSDASFLNEYIDPGIQAICRELAK